MSNNVHPSPAAMALEWWPHASPEDLALYADGIAAERARIVAWLRAEAQERRMSGAPSEDIRIHDAIASDLTGATRPR